MTDAEVLKGGERIAKRIARAGICSRRDAERLIAEGRVAVDGVTLDSPAVLVDGASAITVDGEALPTIEAPRLWRYHKPKGLMTTHKDPQGRPTVFDALPPALPRVLSVGRLDLNSEGLLLLTNSGALSRHLEHPSTGWLRRYRVRVQGRPDPARLKALAAGVTIDGTTYGPVEATIERQLPSNAWINVALREGKNREVRRICEHLGHAVSRLIRVAYGPFQLGTLESGGVEAVAGKVLKEQLGAAYGQIAGGTAPRPAPGKEPGSGAGRVAGRGAGRDRSRAASQAPGQAPGQAPDRAPRR